MPSDVFKVHSRLVIYFFFDKDGIADRYVDFMLAAIQKFSQKIVIVSNGPITPTTRDLFRKYSDDILVRENEGFDVGAYKFAMKYITWAKLCEYDEIVLMNSTIMGPVHSFYIMFNAMEQRSELDFWGITKHNTLPFDPFHCNPYGYIPEHIQSSFIVFRNKFLKTKELKNYWDQLPLPRSYDEAVGKHESYFTKFFSDQGFAWAVYVDPRQDGDTSVDQIIIKDPVRAITEFQCPVFKKRSFFQNSDYYYQETMGEQPIELFSYLKNHTSYDTDMIIENLIRTCNQRDIVNYLGLYYVLPSDAPIEQKTPIQLKTALIIHLYYIDLLEETLHYASSMPHDADIYINTPNGKDVSVIAKKFSHLPNKVTIQLVKNRGRDVSSLLVGAKNIIKNYDLVCFYHDKKVKQLKPYTVGKSFAYLAAESALHSPQYVYNIISTFINNKYLGLLTNIPPFNGHYFDTLGGEWGPNFDNTLKLANELDLHVPMSRDKAPIAPHGSVFWFRVKALIKLFEKDWQYEDFPEEPLAVDGTISHAIERIHPFVVQDTGYYPAYVMPESLATIFISNFTHYVREFNILSQKKGFYGTCLSKRVNMLQALGQSTPIAPATSPSTSLHALKIIMRNIFPQRLYRLILRGKRFLFGPRGLPLVIDD